jgi:hypothetical protein
VIDSRQVKFENTTGETLNLDVMVISDILVLNPKNKRDLRLIFGADWRTGLIDDAEDSPLWEMDGEKLLPLRA